MVVPLILAIALVQAPSSTGMGSAVESPAVEPQLAAGIEVVQVNAETSAPESIRGPIVVGVVPASQPCTWHAQCGFISAAYLGVGGGSYWENYFMWAAQRAARAELKSSRGYATGHAMAVAKAAQTQGSSGPRAQPSGPAPTASGFSGGMYVGKTSSGSGGSSSTRSGSSGTGKPGQPLE